MEIRIPNMEKELNKVVTILRIGAGVSLLAWITFVGLGKGVGLLELLLFSMILPVFSSLLFWFSPFWIAYLLIIYIIKKLKLKVTPELLTLCLNLMMLFLAIYVYYDCYIDPFCLDSDPPLGHTFGWTIAFAIGQLLWTYPFVKYGFKHFLVK